MQADDDAPTAPETFLAHGGGFRDAANGAVVPPIELSSTYARGADYALVDPGVHYSRDENPTYLHAERVLARLEGGARALLFSSGMAGAAAIFHTLRSGDHVVASLLMYHGLRSWLKGFVERYGLELTLFDPRTDGSLAAALRPGRTRLVWIETPSNPTWELTDIAAAAELAHGAGALLACDSTVSTPLVTRPFEHGADLVFHSATKFLNGHSDVVAGAVVGRVEDEAWTRIRTERARGGAILGPFEAWLLHRGLRTLHVRMARAMENAARLAERFDGHAAVERVLWPGLSSHPGHAIAKKQMCGFGAMLSLLLADDPEGARARRVASTTRCFLPATSLGGVESLIEHRATVEGPDSPTPKNLLRLSVGIEDADDLIRDLERALEA